MVYVESYEEFEREAENIYISAPMKVIIITENMFIMPMIEEIYIYI